ncbi:MAG TPA: T9SS type A sorting domain-containing protein [Balneolaceae bacterium]|nr:T9SS type A sorting domain-containing protein [Balneolaceae bacterium]
MGKNATKVFIGLLFIMLSVGIAFWMESGFGQAGNENIVASAKKAAKKMKGETKTDQDEGNKDGGEMAEKKARQAYFFRMLRDPATNKIPEHIREHEINHAKKMPTRHQLLKVRASAANTTTSSSTQASPGFNWQLAGPPAVGGRTRALGIDQRNSNIIIAGGVSGGIWKSTDGGSSWHLETPGANNFSVTSLDQDPTHPNTWYYASGEYLGNSASSSFNHKSIAPYYGTGIFKSTDNGNTWKRIPSTKDTDTQFDSQFDFISRIRVSPTTGTVFVASNGFGIFRSPGGKKFNDLTLGGRGQHAFADVAVASDGTVAAVLSSVTAGTSGGQSGIFVSHDDGQSWSNITPSSFPSNYRRSVIAFAPSNPNILYDFTLKAGSDTTSNQGVSFYKLDLSGNPKNAKDRAGNLPDFGGYVGGISPQGGYNMTLKVKPDNPNFVLVGGVDLFRSTDGFSTGPSGNTSTQKDKYWIGGYAKSATDNNAKNYPNQHADQHIQVFDPNHPDSVWAGHDGGLSETNNIKASSVKWNDKNKGYIVTQFYDASLAPTAGSNRLMGGTQDNGTPFFTLSSNQKLGNSAADISSGDGGYSFFTKDYIYVSIARGGNNNPIIRYNSDFSGTYNFVQPAQAKAPLFIDPYAIDPNNEGTMYYAAGSKLYRNTEVDKINNQNYNGATQGWQAMDATSLPNYLISAVSVSTVPSNILYYAGSSTSQQPVIMRLNNARTSNSTPKNISIPNAPSGAYIHDIAVNPANANDVLAVMTNYNIVGLYHSKNGGKTWQAVEGNLTGNNQPGSSDAGPSIRSATIIPAKSGTIYMVGTSTGVYSTRNLDGNNTTWVRESPYENNNTPDIGYSVVEDITSRFSDGDVAVGTHGRGMFIGHFQGNTVSANIPRIELNPQKGLAGNPMKKQKGTEIKITAHNFQFTAADSVLFNNIKAKIATTSFPASTIMAYVPRVPVPAGANLDQQGNYPVTVKVKRNGITPTATFAIEPPSSNGLSQNYPNPFRNRTNIPFDLASESHVTLILYDITGRRIDVPVKEKLYQQGTHNISLNFSGHASGVYIYQIRVQPTTPGSKAFTYSKKFTFIR